MAQAIGCDLCGQEPAVLLQTNIDTGEVISIGPSCAFSFYVGAARGMAENMPLDVREANADAVTVLIESFFDDGPQVPEAWVKALTTPIPGLAAESDGTATDGDAGGQAAEHAANGEASGTAATLGPEDSSTAPPAGDHDASVGGKAKRSTADSPARAARGRTRTPR
jgi:hypothetical protein